MALAPNNRPHRRSVARISVDSLFGLYSYDIEFPRATDGGPGHFLLLYGDNGSGKSTILRVLAGLFSGDDDYSAALSFLYATPFLAFRVLFDDDSRIELERDDAHSPGFRASLVVRGSGTATANLRPQEKGEAWLPASADPRRFWHELAVLGLRVRLLSADRRATVPDAGDPSGTYSRIWKALSEPKTTQSTAEALQLAIQQFNTAVARAVFEATGAGEQEINSLYLSAVRGLVHEVAHSSQAADLASLQDTIGLLAERSSRFAEYGLVPDPSLDSLRAEIRQAPAGASSLIQAVVGPYLQSLGARLDALSAVQAVLDTFVREANAFLRDKRAAYSHASGLTVLGVKGAQLAPNQLSSGEQQLLLLLCNVVLAAEEPSLFLVDEPELSLNVKWQRRLVDAIAAVSRDSGMQVIMATHSLELLSEHPQCVHRLLS